MGRRNWKNNNYKKRSKIPLSQPVGLIGICGLLISFVIHLPADYFILSAFVLLLAYVLFGYERWTYHHTNFRFIVWILIPCFVMLFFYFGAYSGSISGVDYSTITGFCAIASVLYSVWITRYSGKQFIQTATIIVGCIGIAWLVAILFFVPGFHVEPFQNVQIPELGTMSPSTTDSPIYTGKFKIGQIATNSIGIEGYAIVGNDFSGNYKVKRVFLDKSGKGWHTQGPQQIQAIRYDTVESTYPLAWAGGIMDTAHIPDRDWTTESNTDLYIDADSQKTKSITTTEHTSFAKSKEILSYINEIRDQYGRDPLSFDDRIYILGLARTNDMVEYGYMDHTNPITGTCADSIKYQYSFGSWEYLAENARGSSQPYYEGIEKDAVDSWMKSRGHRYNLLYPHISGAVVCSNGYCVFLGLNHDRFGEGCHTGAEGLAFWNSASMQEDEVRY